MYYDTPGANIGDGPTETASVGPTQTHATDICGYFLYKLHHT